VAAAAVGAIVSTANTNAKPSAHPLMRIMLPPKRLVAVDPLKLDPQVSLPGALCPILPGSLHRYDPGRGAERPNFYLAALVIASSYPYLPKSLFVAPTRIQIGIWHPNRVLRKAYESKEA
jgi:hypothetical protein